MIRLYGAHFVEATPVVYSVPGDRRSIALPRRFASVQSLTETYAPGYAAEARTADDYAAIGSAGRLVRLPEGTRWGWRVTATVIPTDDSEARKAAIVALVRLRLAETPYQSESVAGEYSYTLGAADAHAQRSDILQSLAIPRL